MKFYGQSFKLEVRHWRCFLDLKMIYVGHILEFQIGRSGDTGVPADFIDFFEKMVYFPSLGAFFAHLE